MCGGPIPPKAKGCRHHVVYEQHVRRAGGDPYDPANQLIVCVACHRAHHQQNRKIESALIPASAIAFAFDLFGPGAFDYFGRRYARASEDPRLLALLTPPAGSSGTQDGGGP